MPVDISSEEKLRDYLHQSTLRLVDLVETGQLKFKDNEDLAHFTQLLLLISDLACEGKVSYQHHPGEVLH